MSENEEDTPPVDYQNRKQELLQELNSDTQQRLLLQQNLKQQVQNESNTEMQQRPLEYLESIHTNNSTATTGGGAPSSQNSYSSEGFSASNSNSTSVSASTLTDVVDGGTINEKDIVAPVSNFYFDRIRRGNSLDFTTTGTLSKDVMSGLEEGAGKNNDISTTSFEEVYRYSEKKKNLKLSSDDGTSGTVMREGEFVNKLPVGSSANEFYSRPVTKKMQMPPIKEEESFKVRKRDQSLDPPIGSLLLPRKVPVKIEPKVFLANERTFLLWMHSALWLFGASMTILTYSNYDERRIMYGALLLPVSVVFIVYSIFQYIRRNEMLHNKDPGPYLDIMGPTVLGMLVMISIISQFVLHFYVF